MGVSMVRKISRGDLERRSPEDVHVFQLNSESRVEDQQRGGFALVGMVCGNAAGAASSYNFRCLITVGAALLVCVTCNKLMIDLSAGHL